MDCVEISARRISNRGATSQVCKAFRHLRHGCISFLAIGILTVKNELVTSPKLASLLEQFRTSRYLTSQSPLSLQIMALLNSGALQNGTRSLCSTCISHDCVYHVCRYEDDCVLEDRRTWDGEEGGKLVLLRRDKLGGLYFSATNSTRLYLNTYKDAKTRLTVCELCSLIVA